MDINKDHSGKTSTNRTIALWAWGIFGICWLWATYKAGVVAPVPDTALVLLGLASGGQVGNRYLNETRQLKRGAVEAP